MGLKMQDGSEGLLGMAEVKSVSLLLSHVLCHIITVIILKRSVKLTRGPAWHSWLIGNQRKDCSVLWVSSGQREDSGGKGQDLDETETSAT